MRTTFGEISLFNDDLCFQDTSFIWNGKGWKESKLGERQRDYRRCETERCSESSERVAAWVVNLTVGQFLLKLEKG